MTAGTSPTTAEGGRISAHRAPLAGAEVYEWVALRRVSGGEVAKVGDRWLDSGHPVPGYVAGALAGLLAGGLVMLIDPDLGAAARVALTIAGADRYERLCQQILLLPGAEFIDPAGGRELPGYGVSHRSPSEGRSHLGCSQCAEFDRRAVRMPPNSPPVELGNRRVDHEARDLRDLP